jgi:GNAT superfamily N-acetyltransferase
MSIEQIEVGMPISGVLTLRDGACVPVREIRAEDAGALQRLVARSSERSIELRFFGPLKELSEERARRFAEVDGVDRFALVALDPEDEGELVAVVRYELEAGTDGAEYAALVEDRFQGRGLGIGLTRQLIEAARERGLKRLHALVMRENKSMLSLLRSLELPEHARWENGLEHVEIDLRSEEAA